jgi:6-pyruvoyltetrahydropterin/6-carboxytetrahydropterin synthase
MFTVKKSFRVPLAHRLSCHLGRCKNIHGHEIKVEVEIKREELNKNGMVIDFYDLKNIVNEILDLWDHALLLNTADTWPIVNALQNDLDLDQRVVPFHEKDPTSENMCFVLFNLLYQRFIDFDKELVLKSVSVWESSESQAKYEN